MLVQSIKSAFSVPFCSLAPTSFLFHLDSAYTAVCRHPLPTCWAGQLGVGLCSQGGGIALIDNPPFSWDQQLVHCWPTFSSGQSVPTCASVALVSVSVSACLYLSLCLFSLHAKSKTDPDFKQKRGFQTRSAGVWCWLLISPVTEHLCLGVSCSAALLRKGRGQLRTGCRGRWLKGLLFPPTLRKEWR